MIAFGYRRHVVIDHSGSATPGRVLDDRITLSTPYDCRDDCTTCSRQYFPVSRELNDSEAKDLVDGLVAKIMANHALLQTALDSSADAIAHRWRKRSREKRRALLASISTLHPEQYGIRFMIPDRAEAGEQHKVHNFVSKTSTTHLDTWLAPWLDIEQLSQSPLVLLSLLHHRTSRHPAEWVMFDYSNLSMAQCYGVLGRPYNRHAVRLTADGFGDLVDWNKQQVHSHECFGLNAGFYMAQSGRASLLYLGGSC
jgi:hypothetical protein